MQRKRAQRAALEQGVRLSGLASSWAALVVHACAFLKPEGRLAMVLPAELLTPGTPRRSAVAKRRFKARPPRHVRATAVRATRWSKSSSSSREGPGGCNALTLVPVEDAADLPKIRMFGPCT